MKTFFRKHIVTIFISMLIVAIILLSVALLKKQNYETPIDKVNVTDSTVENTSKDNTPTVIPYNYSPLLPKPAQSSDLHNYEQYIEGNGDILLNKTIASPLGTYVIVSSNCTIGDVSSQNNSVGILLVDGLGTIKNSFIIQSSTDVSYVESTLTKDGIILITHKDSSTSYDINLIDFDLENSYLLNVTKGDSLKIVNTNNNFIIVVNHPNNNVFYIYENNSFSLKTIDSGNLIKFFEFNDYYMFFFNNENSYSQLLLNKNLDTIKTKTIQNSTLVDIIPIIENNIQKFISIEKFKTTTINKMTIDLNIEKTTTLGNVDILFTTLTSNNVILSCAGQINGIITVDYELNLTTNSQTDTIYKDIFATFYINNIVYNLVADINSNLLLIKSTNETITTIPIADKASFASMIPQKNQTFIIAFNSIYNSFNNVKLISIGQ